MDRRELDRYKRTLLEKRGELPVDNTDVGRPVQAAGASEGDFVDQANADAEADGQVRLHQFNGRLLRAIDGALGRIKQGTFGICETNLFHERAWKLCLGLATAAIAKSAHMLRKERLTRTTSYLSLR